MNSDMSINPPDYDSYSHLISIISGDEPRIIFTMSKRHLSKRRKKYINSVIIILKIKRGIYYTIIE